MNSGLNDIVIKRFVVGPLGTNCYVVHGKDSREGLLIDPGACDPGIAAYIRDNKINVQYILNTHGHPDHVAGNLGFGFPILIHELDESYIRPIKPAWFLRDGDVITLGGIKLEIIHTPGHTPGSVSVRSGDILFSGDTLFLEGVGRTDLPGGDHAALLKSVKEKLMVLPDSVRVFPGHGPETTIGHEKENNPFL
ncbi:MAG: MBL fold metallo-hydrolase [Candidatus Omnitrophota bacterium]